jgi:hypothetical protein
LFNDNDTIAGASTFYWDKVNNRVGIGTSTPTNTLDINGTARVQGNLTTNSATSGILIRDWTAINTFRAFYKSSETPSDTNYLMAFDTDVILNSRGSGTDIRFNGGIRARFGNAFSLRVIGTGTTTATVGFEATNSSSTPLFQVRDNGAVLINTTTDSGFTLDVNGTARIVNTLRLAAEIVPSASAFTNGPLISYVTASGWASGRRPGISFWGDATSGVYFYFDGSLNFRAINDAGQSMTFASQAYVLANQPWAISGSNISYSTGNVGIGTSSPSVPLHVSATSTTTAIFQQSGRPNITFLNGATSIGVVGGAVAVSGGTTNDFGIGTNGTNNNLVFATGAGYSERFRIAGSTGNLLINTTTDAGFRLDVNGPARVSGNFNIATGFELNFNNANVGLYRSANSLRLGGFGGIEFLSSPTTIASQTVRMVLFDTGNLCIGNTLDVASARLIVNSTTQGFLPPRMDSTQKNAISGPAAGLMIYDTTLNRPCFYNGTTWITL